MIIQRIVVRYKPGKTAAGVRLLRAEIERADKSGLPKVKRHFLKSLDQPGVTTGEYRFASTQAMETWWAKWTAQPEAQAFDKKYRKCVAEMTQELFEAL